MKSAQLLVAVALLVALGCGGDEIPDVPVVSIGGLPSTLTGDVAVPFTVSDASSRLVNVTFTFGRAPVPTEPATAASTSAEIRGLETSPTGTAYAFTWDTTANLDYDAYSNVYLAAQITAGSEEGIGDEKGPLVVDNTGLPQFFDLRGSIKRSPVLLGTPGTTLAGTLYIGLFTNDATCPPSCAAVAGQPVQNLGGPHDFADVNIDRPYQPFLNVPAGTYKMIAVLDHNDNLFSGGPMLVDAGDLINTDMSVTVMTENTQHDVIINYAYDL